MNVGATVSRLNCKVVTMGWRRSEFCTFKGTQHAQQHVFHVCLSCLVGYYYYYYYYYFDVSTTS